jgi:hypothetical protein
MMVEVTYLTWTGDNKCRLYWHRCETCRITLIWLSALRIPRLPWIGTSGGYQGQGEWRDVPVVCNLPIVGTCCRLHLCRQCCCRRNHDRWHRRQSPGAGECHASGADPCVGYNSGVYFRDRCHSRDGARLRVTLKDGTQLTLGENTTLVLDEFVYDPFKSRVALSVRVIKGAFLFVGGRIEGETGAKVQIHTPLAVLGVPTEWITPQRRLNQHRKPVEALAYIGRSGRQPDAGARRQADHRSASSTCRSAVASTLP